MGNLGNKLTLCSLQKISITEVIFSLFHCLTACDVCIVVSSSNVVTFPKSQQLIR